MLTVVPVDVQLLVSFVSFTRLVPSAQASTKYVLIGVVVGITSVTAPLFVAPAASAGTLRIAASTRSSVLFTWLSER